jgi:hypothetical protein
MIQDQLERSLGGVFSLLSQELQLPMVKLLLRQMMEQGSLPELPEELVEPVVVTGVLAIGRATDSLKLDQFLGTALQTIGPETVAAHINVGEWFTRKAASLGIATEGLIKSAAEIQAEQQAQMQQALQMQGGEEAVKAMGQMAVNQQQQSPEIPE